MTFSYIMLTVPQRLSLLKRASPPAAWSSVFCFHPWHFSVVVSSGEKKKKNKPIPQRLWLFNQQQPTHTEAISPPVSVGGNREMDLKETF